MTTKILKRKKNEGQVVILVALFAIFVSSSLIMIISSPVVSQLKTNRILFEAKKSYYLSESGNEDIVYRTKNGENIVGQKNILLNDGSAGTIVTDLENGVKEVVTTANVNNKIRKIKSRIQVTSGVSFNYGLFTGQGGIEMENNTRINGSVYSNGSIEGAGNVMIAGDVYVAPRSATTTNLKWIVQNNDFAFGRYVDSQQRVDAVQSFATSTSELQVSKISLYVKKIGSPANLNIKIVKDKSGSPDKNNILATGEILSSFISENYAYVDVGFNSNPKLISNQLYWIVADMARDDANYYVWGIDTSAGYSLGSAKYSSDWTKSSFVNVAGDLDFKVWTTDEEGLGTLDTVIVGDGVGGVFNAYAHNIIDSQISGDAFTYSLSGGTVDGNIIANSISNCTINGDADYNIKTNCNVGGSSHSPTTPPVDPPYLPTPISEANIEAWKNEAISFGTITAGDLTADDGDTIGPGVIGGDLIIESNTTVSLGGTLYVLGNIIINGDANIELGAGYGANGSGLILSDGWIDLYNNVDLNYPRSGSGHLMLMSLARCDKYYGFTTCNSDVSAINVSNNVHADILVAPYGIIEMTNNVSITALVGDQLNLKNNIILNYEQGLTNMNFSSGPSGSWGIESWREIE
ncbi:hypothetical protein A2996_01525 [Candidatus Campbellbacteria bacterium RIFCSPLOWO2_01_FULL_34_15]|uniref:Type 4 fimbrial biogenesis protein PilX N-terminal domain-containing protein n=1 Tax=Candidatus Campbellbacteria bacterium RIFCSPLOWO2_01_FULL_34_15 TaxID=1797579 RepID=A0A1F5EM22_9BACT|nr:MAG: hypothetical protein A2996_01525 [Candidatus Campbellbacteria bacterium RIFCSPLOWO2_01_FULL_34_15]